MAVSFTKKGIGDVSTLRLRGWLGIVGLGVVMSACGSGASKSEAKVPAADSASAGSDSAAAALAVQRAAGQEGYAICQTCHQENGQGIPSTYPPLAGSEFINGPPERVIAIVLHGMTGPLTVGGQEYNNAMAPWGSLTDEQIADIITYERTSWGNTGTPVTAEQVAAVRKATAQRTEPWTAADLAKASFK